MNSSLILLSRPNLAVWLSSILFIPYPSCSLIGKSLSPCLSLSVCPAVSHFHCQIKKSNSNCGTFAQWSELILSLHVHLPPALSAQHVQHIFIYSLTRRMDGCTSCISDTNQWVYYINMTHMFLIKILQRLWKTFLLSFWLQAVNEDRRLHTS